MADYRVTLECCKRVIRVRLPRGVNIYEITLTCEKPKCQDSMDEFTRVEDPPKWQDESRTYTTGERHLDRRLDCRTVRREAAA